MAWVFPRLLEDTPPGSEVDGEPARYRRGQRGHESEAGRRRGPNREGSPLKETPRAEKLARSSAAVRTPILEPAHGRSTASCARVRGRVEDHFRAVEGEPHWSRFHAPVVEHCTGGGGGRTSPPSMLVQKFLSLGRRRAAGPQDAKRGYERFPPSYPRGFGFPRGWLGPCDIRGWEGQG